MRTADYKNLGRPYKDKQNLRELVERLSPSADGEVLVGTAANEAAWESGNTLRTSLGLGTGDSPQFTAIELGHATDTTLSRGAAGILQVEGNEVPSPGSVVAGDILYADGTNSWARLAKGSDTNVLTLASGLPSWAASTGGDALFTAYLSADANDVTGGGATYTVAFNTELFDTGADYNNSTYTFTAPTTGQYLFIAQVTIHEWSSLDEALADVDWMIRLTTSNRNYDFKRGDDPGSSASVTHTLSVIADMDASDTATVTVDIDARSDNSDVLDVTGGSTPLVTFFSGYHIA